MRFKVLMALYILHKKPKAWVHSGQYTDGPLRRRKSPVKNLVRQRCAEGFNSGVKWLIKRLARTYQRYSRAVGKGKCAARVRTKINFFSAILVRSFDIVLSKVVGSLEGKFERWQPACIHYTAQRRKLQSRKPAYTTQLSVLSTSMLYHNTLRIQFYPSSVF
jgi:hypothetical protein